MTTTETIDTVKPYEVKPTEIVGSRGGVETLVFPIPNDYHLAEVPVRPARERATPLRNYGTIVVKDSRSFVAYVDKHHTSGTEFYADSNAGTVTAVLNAPDHGESEPAWADHRVVLQLTETEAWKAWAGHHNGQLFGQEAFAEFIEDQSPVFVQPDAASMLDIASNFHATVDRQFSSRIRTNSGQVQFTHNEVIDGRVGEGDTLEVPKVFTIRVRVWEGTRDLDIPLLFRYRIQSGLKLGWKMNQISEIKRQVFDALVGDLSEALAPKSTDPKDDVKELAVIYLGPAPDYRHI